MTSLTKIREALDDIAAERQRQIKSECWSAEHDDTHTDGSLAAAAACYALPAPELGTKAEFEYPGPGECDRMVIWHDIPTVWPRSWHAKHWKPKDRRRNLVRAAALIVAEIARLDRQCNPDSLQTTPEREERQLRRLTPKAGEWPGSVKR